MKTVLYLIQASAGLPKIYECLKTRSYLLLSYKEDTSDTTIYAPNTTWTGGRNRLYQYVKDNNLLYDYYVFMDEDVVLKNAKSILIPNLNPSRDGSLVSTGARIPLDSLWFKWPLKALFSHYSYQPEEQEAGFENFEESLKLGYPLMTVSPWGYNAAKGSQRARLQDVLPEEIRAKGLENLNWPFQTIDWMDGILNALSQDVFFANTVLPYTEKYDADSWWISAFIFFTKANHYYPHQIIQNNQFTIINTQHGGYPKQEVSIFFKTLAQIYTEVCAELEVDKIQFSEGKEIKAPMSLKQVEGRFMSRFAFFARTLLPTFIFSSIHKLRHWKWRLQGKH